MSVKDINITSPTFYLFGCIINIEEINRNNIKLDEKS